MTSNTEKIAQLKAGIEALEAQRPVLGDAVVDLSLQALHQQITELETASASVVPSKGERRQATILFSDLSGYTAMNEKLDPEVVQELMNRIKIDAIRIIEYYGGTVNQFVGDEVLALFGVPNAHEDDPLRAVNAALELHEMVREMNVDVEELIGHQLTMHSGINTGLIVTTVWDERDGKFSLTGDTVNTGARLVAQAGANEILVSPQTQALIAPYFRTESLEPVMMKGKAAPVVPHRILGKTKVQTRLEAAKQKGFTPYIGRAKELATLHSCLRKTMNGNGQFVSIRGTAGLGKSRLLYEFRHQLDRQKVTVLQGRCQSFGISTPYLPFQDALRRGLRLADEDTPGTLHEKAVNNLLKIDPTLKEHIPVFLHLLSIPSEQYPLPTELSGEQLKLKIQEALVAIHILNTRHKPMVLVLEDWHWADEGSDRALLKLLNAIATHPLMVVVLYRPEYTPKWSEFAYHQDINLSAVHREGVVQIIKAVYGVDQLPEDFASQIFKHSGGNPFFIEELCTLLREEGTVIITDEKILLQNPIDQINFPQTVQAVIRAKLDHLDAKNKEVMRLASVIGREFLHRILEHIAHRKEEVPSSLQYLQRVDFIRHIENLPELTYQFNHVITQEVTYQTILIKQRTFLHGLVAETIEILYEKRLEEQYEMLAYHYSKSKNWEKALFYLELAGDKALKNFSLLDARNYYREAIALMDAKLKTKKEEVHHLKPRRIELSIKWAKASHYAGPTDTISVLETSLTYAQALNRQSNIAHLNYWLGQRHVMLGNTQQATQYFNQCIEWTEQTKEKTLLALAYAALGRGVYIIDAEYEKARDYLERCVPIFKEVKELDYLAYVSTWLGVAYAYAGSFEKALKYANQAIEIVEETQNLNRMSIAYGCMSMCFVMQGDWEKGIEAGNTSTKVSRPRGELILLSAGLLNWGYALFMKGSKAGGLAKIFDSLEIMEAGKFPLIYPPVYGHAAYCCAQVGQYEKAKDAANKCLEWSAKSWKGYECFAYYALALVYENDSNPQKAAQMMEEGFRVCRERGQYPYLALGFYDYAKILFAREDRQKAQAHLQQAVELFTNLNMTWWLQQARELQEQLVE